MSKRTKTLAGVVLGIICECCLNFCVARAAVDGSPHDLPNQSYTAKGDVGEGKCVWCHIPTLGGDAIPMDSPPPSVSYYSRSGLVCYSCHDGTSIVDPVVDASLGAFHPSAHTLKWNNLPVPKAESGLKEMDSQDKKIECTTCHAPHDNSLRPFLRTDMASLCVICHQGMENKGYGRKNESGSHPVHETVEDDSGKASPIKVKAEFSVPFPTDYPLEDGRLLAEIHWRRGGHLKSGNKGTVECVTCHPVHGVEDAVPIEGMLTANPVRIAADEFCESCHQGKRGDDRKEPSYPNPGGTTTGRTYHPCDDDRSNGDGWRVNIRPATSWPMGEGSPKILFCTTCHVAHGGMPQSPALRKPVQAETFCEECHLNEISPFHHPIPSDFGGRLKCFPTNGDPSYGIPREGRLYCSSCHVAHNAGLKQLDEKEYIPILRYNLIGNDDLCLSCHPADNVLCKEKEKGTASHFLGNPNLPDTYNDANPPINTSPWPETQLLSRYGRPDNETVLCISCHSFQKSPNQSEPFPYFVLARSGNEYEWGDDPSTYLCTGCHGTNPAGNESTHTHPLLDAKISNLKQPPQPPVTATINNHINCDTCHRPHEAITGGGYYILEDVLSDNKEPKTVHPQIDFTVLCHRCHATY